MLSLRIYVQLSRPKTASISAKRTFTKLLPCYGQRRFHTLRKGTGAVLRRWCADVAVTIKSFYSGDG